MYSQLLTLVVVAQRQIDKLRAEFTVDALDAVIATCAPRPPDFPGYCYSAAVACSFPKCGTTWMQQIVLLLFNDGDAAKAREADMPAGSTRLLTQ